MQMYFNLRSIDLSPGLWFTWTFINCNSKYNIGGGKKDSKASGVKHGQVKINGDAEFCRTGTPWPPIRAQASRANSQSGADHFTWQQPLVKATTTTMPTLDLYR